MTPQRIIKYSFIGVILCLFLYSFTQVSLSLTLSQASIFQTIQKSFQQIGFFQRPLSTTIFLVILFALFAYYVYFLINAYKRKLKAKDFWILVIATAVILAFSFNAFSFDLFNYIFDAKIITYYQENPYVKRALDFPGDPMLSFMHWTHRVYPYGPFWLVLTTPLSFIGANIFLITFFLFKFLAAGFFLGSVFLIYKINERLNPDYKLFNTALFAFNPLVIIESLVSAHNDIAMVFFALLGIYLYFVKNKILGIVSVILSAAIKIPTAVLLLPMIINLLPLNKYNLNQERFIWLAVFLSIGGIFYSMTKLEIQPWYFLWVIPFIALLRPNKYILSLTVGVSLGLLLRYIVYLYFGNWDGEALIIRNALTVTASIIPVILVLLYDKKRQKLL